MLELRIQATILVKPPMLNQHQFTSTSLKVMYCNKGRITCSCLSSSSVALLISSHLMSRGVRQYCKSLRNNNNVVLTLLCSLRFVFWRQNCGHSAKKGGHVLIIISCLSETFVWTLDFPAGHKLSPNFFYHPSTILPSNPPNDSLNKIRSNSGDLSWSLSSVPLFIFYYFSRFLPGETQNEMTGL